LLDKEKYENSAKNSINTIKSKYQIEIKDLTDNQQKLHNDLIQINKEIEEEVDGLNKLFDNQEKMRGELNYIHEKLTELLEINDGLKNELDRVKSDRDSKLNDLIMSFSGEKENLKGKIIELIEKNSENERKKGRILIDFEREKTKLSLDKEKYENHIRELIERVENNDKKVGLLLKENEKIKK